MHPFRKQRLKLGLNLGLAALIWLMLSSPLLADSEGQRVYGLFDVSILLKAAPLAGVGQWPDLSFDLRGTGHLPIFNQDQGTEIFPGLINPVLQNEILLAFDELNIEAFRAFPIKAIVLGVRMDPCANGHESGATGCIRELRLVAESPELSDRSVHLVYRPTETEFQSMLREIKLINDTCSGLKDQDKLVVHPCSDDAKFLQDLNRVILAHAKNESLAKVTFQISTADSPMGVFWIFAAVEKDENAKWSLLKTKSAPKGEEFFAFGAGPGFFGGIVLDQKDQSVVSALKEEISEEEATVLVAALEDTKATRVSNTSCMSCHAVQSIRSRHTSLTLANPEYFKVNQLEAETSLSPGRADIRHFGYRFGQPKISTRTQKETKESVDYLNAL